MSSLTGKTAVVCDIGSAWFRCGHGGSDCPDAFIESLTGRQNFADQNASTQDILVGKACTQNTQDLKLSRPVKHGAVQDWEGASKLWEHAFCDQLGIDPEMHKILLTEAPSQTGSNRRRTFEIMFERFGFAAAFAQAQAALTLYAQGLMTGLSVDAGDVTFVVPVVDGYSFPHLIKRLDIAGQQVTGYLLELLQRFGYSFNHTTDLDSIRQMKEQVCYVACDYQREVKLARETTCVMQNYTLPDGRTIKVGAERFIATEAMFQPRLIDKECDGLSDMIFSCIQGMDLDNRMPMYQHIVLSGASTMFGGLPNRIERDIRALYLQHTLQGDHRGLRKLKLRIDDPPQRQNLVFLGAAILANIMQEESTFWISRAEWEEDPFRALKKCGGC